MTQYTEEYEDADTEYLDDFEVEEDDNDDDEEGYDDDDEEGFGDFESFEGYDDDDEESLAERRRYSRRFPKFRQRSFRRRFRQPQRFRSVGSISRGIVRTPAGTARVRLPKAVATRASVNARFQEVKREIGRNTKAIKKVDSTLEKNTSIVDRKINAVRSDLRKSNKKMREQLQQATLLPLLLQSKPKLESITLEMPVGKTTGPIELPVTAQKFHSDSDNLLPLLLMMGGLGGGSSSSTNMLMMLALSGSLGISK